MFSHLFGLSLSLVAQLEIPFTKRRLLKLKPKRFSVRNPKFRGSAASAYRAKISRERSERRVAAFCPKAERESDRARE